MNSEPLVSVCIITYNHEKFIAQAIESVVSQKCDFKFELIIGEDCSKDKTREIVQSYAVKYPEIIVPLLPEKNLGPQTNLSNCFIHARGKYIACIEGDDYWIDAGKLQMQFDFMEANPEFSLCFTRSITIDDDERQIEGVVPALTKDEFSIEEDIVMTERTFIPTATLFFRNILPKPLPQFYMNAMSGDIAIHLLLSDKGKVKCLPGFTAIYRDHQGGISKNEKVQKEGFKRIFKLYIAANKYFDYRHNNVIMKRLSQMSKIKLIYGSKDLKGLRKIKYVFQNAPDYFKYSDTISAKEITYYFIVLFFPFLIKLRK